MANRWIITFVDGSTEVTPAAADRLRTEADGALLRAMATRSYGPDDVVKTYVLANVRSWEPRP